jgi:hypothetical protein
MSLLRLPHRRTAGAFGALRVRPDGRALHGHLRRVFRLPEQRWRGHRRRFLFQLSVCGLDPQWFEFF